jgi:peptidyl-prolyl cis-trans isomerase B (cyclophilin B)
MTDLEALFSDAAALAEEGHPSPGDPIAMLGQARRTRRRRRGAALALPAVAAVVAAAVIVPSLLTSGHRGGTSSLAGRTPEPGSFVAVQDGHAGLYDARDGALVTELGQAVAVSAGSDGYWVGRAIGCTSTLSFVAADSTTLSSEQQVDGLITDVAVSPDGKTLAYGVDRKAADPDPNARCGGSDLVLLDVATGTERRWSGHDDNGQLSSLSWSSDGRQLAFQVAYCCDETIEVHVVDPASSPEPLSKSVRPTSRDCLVKLPAYVGETLVAARQCETKTQLVALEPRHGGPVIRDLPENTEGLAIRDDTMLVELYGSAETPGDLVRIDPDGTTTTLGRHFADLSWAPRDTGNTTHGVLTRVSPTPAASEPAASERAGGACVYRPSTDGHIAKDVGTPPALATGLPTSATIHTNRGDITIALRAAATPCTVNSFAFLAKAGYFDATPCHRLTTMGIFVVQCGDPTSTGSGGPGYVFGDEDLPGTTYPEATVAMANSGPNTNGSQFFLVYADTTLDANYTRFGTITAGLDVLREVAAGGAEPANDGKPKLSLTITGITLR